MRTIVLAPQRYPAAKSIRVAAIASTLLLSACATFSPDGGMGLVAGIAGQELGREVAAIRTPEQAAAAHATVEQRLRGPLDADAAVQVALLNNRGLQAAYNELGLAEAARVEASLPPNPTLSVGRMVNPFEIEIEKKLVANILALATLPARAEIAGDRFRQAQLRAAEETLRLAAEARRTYYRAVAARELVGFLDQAKAAAETATRLSRRLGETGASNRLDQAREQVFYAEITAQLATARQRATSERERLIRLMGLWGDDLAFTLPSALPPLPRAVRSLPDIEIEAVRRRIDLQIARMEVETLGKSYGLTQATRFVNLLEVAGMTKSAQERGSGESVRSNGVELEFQVPIFDFGAVRTRQAEETYLRAIHRLTEKAVNARSEARDAYRVYRSSYDIAAHYRREVLPLRKLISEEMLLRYNAMIVDVFALLTEAQQRIAAHRAAIEARRDFWLASVDLTVAVAGGGVAGSNSETVAAAAPGAPAGH
jgi:outer membrane protein TolC